MVIRDAGAPDLGAIARVHVASWRSTYRGIVPQAHLDRLREDHREKLWRQVLAHDDTGNRRFVVAPRSCGRLTAAPDWFRTRGATL